MDEGERILEKIKINEKNKLKMNSILRFLSNASIEVMKSLKFNVDYKIIS